MEHKYISKVPFGHHVYSYVPVCTTEFSGTRRYVSALIPASGLGNQKHANTQETSEKLKMHYFTLMS
jgi:hypothetical protein